MTAATKAPRESLTLRDSTDLLADLNRWVEDNIDAIELNGGALPDDLAAMLDEILGAQRTKADAIAAKMDEFLGYATAAKATKDRAARREKVWANTIASIKAYVLRELGRLGVDRITGTVAVLRRQTNSAPAVECAFTPEQLLAAWDCDHLDGDHEAATPLMKFATIRREVVLDKKALVAAYVARRAELERGMGNGFEHDAAAVDSIAHNMAVEFPGISVFRGSHLRVD